MTANAKRPGIRSHVSAEIGMINGFGRSNPERDPAGRLNQRKMAGLGRN